VVQAVKNTLIYYNANRDMIFNTASNCANSIAGNPSESEALANE
jgi:electron transport complex protein RnfG